MDYTIIDAHAHLWLRQDTTVDGLPIRTLENAPYSWAKYARWFRLSWWTE